MFVLLGLVALFAAPVWVITAVVKPLFVVLPGRRPDWGVRLLRWGSGMAVAAAAILLAMALGAVELSDHESRSGADSSPAPACRDAAPHLVERLVGHRASYLPPAFDCVLEDGTTYPASESYVWLNGLVVTCAVVSVLLAVGAGYATDRQTARRMRVPDSETPG
ncbi:hypothetical protein GCM10027160_04310 [Streptomyces calidiresistens]|uniref:Uncharacterized protein n=1 Tax=Streptomyces calidiresistens TaxID=1485586 RepID=A0A7W3T650_9ACTN|nr:hypothetical protein [Streptomyces calidiresistens]MBB0231649.1 hypothetical protein [Streptomyces calidiresistens]